MKQLNLKVGNTDTKIKDVYIVFAKCGILNYHNPGPVPHFFRNAGYGSVRYIMINEYGSATLPLQESHSYHLSQSMLFPLPGVMKQTKGYEPLSMVNGTGTETYVYQSC